MEDWEKQKQQIMNKEICRSCKKPFAEKEEFFVDRYNRNGEFMGREHYHCLGDITCRKCDKHISDLSSIGILLSPMRDRLYGEDSIDDVDRIWICYSCYQLVFHFVSAKIGVEACQ